MRSVPKGSRSHGNNGISANAAKNQKYSLFAALAVVFVFFMAMSGGGSSSNSAAQSKDRTNANIRNPANSEVSSTVSSTVSSNNGDDDGESAQGNDDETDNYYDDQVEYQVEDDLFPDWDDDVYAYDYDPTAETVEEIMEEDTADLEEAIDEDIEENEDQIDVLILAAVQDIREAISGVFKESDILDDDDIDVVIEDLKFRLDQETFNEVEEEAAEILQAETLELEVEIEDGEVEIDADFETDDEIKEDLQYVEDKIISEANEEIQTEIDIIETNIPHTAVIIAKELLEIKLKEKTGKDDVSVTIENDIIVSFSVGSSAEEDTETTEEEDTEATEEEDAEATEEGDEGGDRARKQ